MTEIKVYEVHLVKGYPHGYEITHKPYPASIRGYSTTFNFPGKTAHICIVSNDGGVDRAIALRFATAIATGKYRTRSVDLSVLNNAGVKGEKTR